MSDFIVKLNKLSRLNLPFLFFFFSHQTPDGALFVQCDYMMWWRHWPLDSFSLHTAVNQTLHWFSKCFHNQILGSFVISMKTLLKGTVWISERFSAFRCVNETWECRHKSTYHFKSATFIGKHKAWEFMLPRKHMCTLMQAVYHI